jgi:ribosomal-protein-alanine N-acetyltransferase
MSDTPHPDVDATRERVRGLLERHTVRSGIAWAIFIRDETQLVGLCCLHSISWTNRRADLGFELASRYWRRGLMTEALRAIIGFCFADLRFVKLSAHVTCENEPSQALLAKLGFLEEGLLRQHGFWNGRTHDLKVYGLVAVEA